jgi:hypothetical protein
MKTKEEMSIYKKDWYLKNIEKIKIQRRERYIKNKLSNPNLNKDYYELHKEQKKQYCLSHKEERKEYKKLHRKEINIQIQNKRKTDINYKLISNIRLRLYKTLKGINKSSSTTNLLGCSIKQVRKYLEKKFVKGM